MNALDRAAMLGAAVAVAILFLGVANTEAAEAVTFQGKTVTILVGSRAGGTTDLSARLFAPFVAKYLPGKPTAVVQNMPGAHNMTAMNYFAQRSKHNGQTMIMGSGSEVDPLNYRVPQSRYDPTTFAMIGGVNLGGSNLIIRKEALPRLMNKNAKPVSLGSIAGYPHVGMQMAAWAIGYLGWNARWVTGYGNSADLAVALERGEIDLTGLANETIPKIPPLLDKRKYVILYQTGTDGGTVRSTLPFMANVPMFSTAMRGKITDPIAQQAFNYWRNLSYLFKWMALPPKTPNSIIDVYRTMFHKTTVDPDFIAKSKKITSGFRTISSHELTATVRELGRVSSAALGVMTQLLQKQGLNVEALKKKRKRKKKK